MRLQDKPRLRIIKIFYSTFTPSKNKQFFFQKKFFDKKIHCIFATKLQKLTPEMKEWFAEWFDTHYYHLLYQNRDENEANVFIQNLIKKLNLSKKSRILDLACGRGRHSLKLNEMGYDVLGVDLSTQSINFAQEHQHAGLQFLRADMREVFFKKMPPFDLILNLFTSFGYFESREDERLVLQNMLSAANENGMMVIDFFNIGEVLKNLIPYEKKNIEGITFEIHRELKDGFLTKEILVQDEGEVKKFQEKVRAMRAEDFKLYAESIILKGEKSYRWQIEEVFGDYFFAPFDAENSPRLLIFFRKTLL
jgi:SAM-dependent methyltransferase